MAEQLLKPTEAGALLRVSAKTVGRLVARGKIRGVDVGQGKKRARIRIPESAIGEFIRRAAL